ncbi:hypothetical protein EDC04DRAFT_2792225, partial [Pisolithus marmoratus]
MVFGRAHVLSLVFLCQPSLPLLYTYPPHWPLFTPSSTVRSSLRLGTSFHLLVVFFSPFFFGRRCVGGRV